MRERAVMTLLAEGRAGGRKRLLDRSGPATCRCSQSITNRESSQSTVASHNKNNLNMSAPSPVVFATAPTFHASQR
jgi:hypothetical protein